MKTYVDNTMLARAGIDFGAFEEAFASIRTKTEAQIYRLADQFSDSGLSPKQICVGHSGGKDSSLVHYIARSALGLLLPGSEQFTLFHTPKIAEPNQVFPEDRELLYWLAADRQADLIISKRATPADYGFLAQVDGSRRAEADRSNGRSTEIMVDGKLINRADVPRPFDFTASGLFGISFFYPIYEWSDAEVWAALAAYELPVSRSYRPS